MSVQQGYESPNELVLTHCLEKLRARTGLTEERLEAGSSEVAAPLLSLAAVRRYASVHQVELTTAALAVVRECIRDGLNGTHRIVADAVLGTGLFAAARYRRDVDEKVIDALHSDLLSRRRRTLLANWRQLHQAHGIEPGEAPSDRILRGSLERRVLAELARQMVRREEYSLGSMSVVMPGQGHVLAAVTPNGSRGRVIVVGGAVMDATFRTKVLPERETSREAHDFFLSPGGKGLTQAIAAVRLGLDVSLLAAVADDRFGQEIVEYLRREGVDTSMLKVVSDARTPFTGVIEFELGDSIAVNWRNDREVRLDMRDVERHEADLIASDAVLVTFELPRDSVQRTLALVHGARERRPLIIVTPCNPYSDGSVSGQALSQIDFMVAQSWELGRYAPPERGTFDLDAVARRILAYGVETLCIPTGGGCTIYSETALGTFTVPTFPSTYKESQAARDAFCAALAAQLIEGGSEFSEQVALWATAAMAAAIADYPLPNSMPDRPRVEQLLSRSRFTVAPRAGDQPGLSDAAGAAAPARSVRSDGSRRS
ncbi:MAG TPA: PfkB family carbohydrate kinase [Streptosporangiaceae bacterium]